MSWQPENLEEIQLIVFGNNTTANIKNSGYEVALLPVDLTREKEKYEVAKEKQRKIDDAKHVAGQFLENQLKKGINYFKDPKNREKAVQFGIGIVKLVMKK